MKYLITAFLAIVFSASFLVGAASAEDPTSTPTPRPTRTHFPTRTPVVVTATPVPVLTTIVSLVAQPPVSVCQGNVLVTTRLQKSDGTLAADGTPVQFYTTGGTLSTGNIYSGYGLGYPYSPLAFNQAFGYGLYNGGYATGVQAFTASYGGQATTLLNVGSVNGPIWVSAVFAGGSSQVLVESFCAPAPIVVAPPAPVAPQIVIVPPLPVASAPVATAPVTPQRITVPNTGSGGLLLQ